MKKNSFYAFAFAAILAVTACKKEDALSKVDPNSKDVEMYAPQMVNEAGIPIENTEPNAAVQSVENKVDGKYPVMTFNKKEHDFGVINEGDKVETVFTFTNTGDADLLITNASGSCGCTVPEYPKEPIKPGKSGKMKVTFDSGGKPGMQQKSVNITANTVTGRDVLSIKANVTPKAKPAETTTVTQ
ncbi:MAG: DUF1573 domain-containing protein [Flavobacteriales bacterium]|nr:DUF1573 domain-containing protein [Flavobacteriales bacterium]